MHFKTTIASLLRKIALTACASATAISSADALEVSIDENEVVSLASSPFVNKFSGQIDAAGRPSLSLDLTFTSQCVQDAGIIAKHIRSGDNRPDVVTIERIVPQDGCPDIYMPINQRLQVLLPSSVVDNGIQLISRPWQARNGGMPSQRLNFSAGVNQGHDDVVEASTMTGMRLAKVAVESIQPMTKDGYKINGAIGLGQCASKDIGTSLYEVPDSDGSPIADMLIVTIANECAVQQTDSDFTINIGVPPRGIERTVTVANEANPVSRAIK